MQNRRFSELAFRAAAALHPRPQRRRPYSPSPQSACPGRGALTITLSEKKISRTTAAWLGQGCGTWGGVWAPPRLPAPNPNTTQAASGAPATTTLRVTVGRTVGCYGDPLPTSRPEPMGITADDLMPQAPGFNWLLGSQGALLPLRHRWESPDAPSCRGLPEEGRWEPTIW